MRIVLKFGGTSLADTQKILTAARRAADLARAGIETVAVVSARGHTTDQLAADAEALLLPEGAGREMDLCLSAGEQVSVGLMTMAIRSLGVDAVGLTGWQAGILTDDTFGNARILGLFNDRLDRELKRGRVAVVAGFQGVTEDGEITTLGRGGSDTTAVALAALLGAKLCRIYTDVDGVYDRDPRKFPEAKRFPRIGYAEMLTLARQGAQVLHDRCVELGQEYRVLIQVLSSFRPGPGTFVTDIQEPLLPELLQDIPPG